MQVVPLTADARPEPVIGPRPPGWVPPLRTGVGADLGLDVPAAFSRLVILVPEVGVDPTELADQVRRLDPEARLGVVFVALASPAEADEGWLRRELVTLGSLTRDGRPGVELRVEAAKSWVQAVRSVYQTGDVLVCLRAADPLANLRRRPSLAVTLAQAFDATVVEVEGLHLGGRPSRLSWVRSLLGTVPFLIVAGFLALQISVERNQGGPAWQHQALQVVVLAVEISLIWLWETRVM